MTRALALALLLASGCASRAARADPSRCTLVEDGYGPAGTTPIRVETVASGLEVPWGIAFLPDGDALVTERPGRVRLLRDGALRPEPVARVQAAAKEEGGLLGIALHPRFAENNLFYLYYTASTEDGLRNRIERWRLAGDRLSARPDRVILDGIAAAKYHDGGRLRIGPDGLLWAGTGDASKEDLAQDPKSPNGKILRLGLDGEIPADNPVAGQPLYVLGVRNVQAFDWLDDGRLIVADHGPSGLLRKGHDEVTVARKGDNLGWPRIVGCETKPGLEVPRLSWTTAVPPGGAVLYRGDAIPAWKGSFIIGTLASRHLHRVTLDGKHEVYLKDAHGRLREVVTAPDGTIWVTTSNCDGRGDCPPEKDAILRLRSGS